VKVSVDQMRWSDALKDRPRAGVLIPEPRGRDHHRGCCSSFASGGNEFSFSGDSDCSRDRLRAGANRGLLATGDFGIIAVGFVVAFISALLVVRWLLRYVAHHDFVPFAWYRIAFGLVILGTAYAGLVHWD
jgi:hypothetical protein